MSQFPTDPAEANGLLGRLVLGHRRGSDSAGFALLPPVPIPPEMVLSCGTIPDAMASASWGSRLIHSLASMVLPREAHASVMRGFVGGVGGSTSEFSSFGTVDPTLRTGGVGGWTSEFLRLAPAVMAGSDTTIDGTVGSTTTSDPLPSVTIRTYQGTVIPGVGVNFTAGAPATETPVGDASVCGSDTSTDNTGTAAVSCIDFGTTVRYATAFTKVSAVFTLPPELSDTLADGTPIVSFVPDKLNWLVASHGPSALAFTAPPTGQTYSGSHHFTAPAAPEETSMSHRIPLSLAVSLVLAGCGGAGSSGAVAHEPGVLTLVDTFRVSPDDADLSRVDFMAISPDGDIVVTQPQDGYLKVFGDDGAVRTVGRSGAGPGEFTNVTRIGWIGDTLWALDGGLRRATRFDRDYALLGSTPDPLTITIGDAPADSSAANAGAFVQAVLPGGDLRVAAPFSASHPPAWAAGLDSGSTPFLRVTPEGQIVRLLAVQSADRCEVRYAIGATGSGVTNVPFCAHPLDTSWDGGADLGLLSVTPPEQGDPSYSITVVTPSGDTAFTREFSYTPIPVTQHAIDSLDVLLEQSYAKVPPAMRNARPHPTPAETFPPVDRIVLGRDHTVWLEEHTVDPGHHWLMLSPAGDPVARVTLSPTVKLMAAEHGTIWGTEEDADGLLGIVRYRVS